MRLRADSASGYRFTAVATLAAAAAGITLLAGLIELRLADLAWQPLLSINQIPAPSWHQKWLGAVETAPMQQAAAVREWLQVIVALVFSILLIAGVGALVALFAHATARRYEVALSAVVGASPRQLRGTLLRQASMNAGTALLIGCTAGLILAVIANRAWPDAASFAAPIGWLIASVVFTCGLAAFVAYRAAARMSHVGWMGDVLAPEARTNPGYGAEDLRNILLHLQFALTFALLACALLVWQHGRTSMHADNALPTVNMQVTRVYLPQHATSAQRRALLNEIETSGAVATPGALLGIGTTDQVLANCGDCVISHTRTPIFSIRTQQHVVGSGFFDAIAQGPHTGRDFEKRDANTRHVIVNDTFAALAFLGQHPIGKRIKVGGLRGDWYTVIGVIHDVPVNGLTTYSAYTVGFIKSKVPGKEPAIYFYAQEKPPAIVDVIAPKPIQASLAGVVTGRAELLGQLYNAARAPSRWFAGMLGVLAVAAGIVATLSLGAITLLNVRQRKLEIAARRAVGARRRDILRMILTGTGGVIARGTFVGLFLSIALAQAIRMMLPGMSAIDPAVLAVSALALSIVSLVAAIIPARAAAAVAPAQIHA